MLGVTALVCLQASLVVSATPNAYRDAYQEADKTGQPLVVLVGADWCPGCVKMKNSVIPELQQQGVMKTVSFATVNVDSDPELANKLMQGRSMPQIIVYQKTPEGGWKRDQLTGAHSAAETAGLIQRSRGLFGRITGRR